MRYICFIRIVTIVILVASGQGSYAMEEPYYTWVDEDGVVNYSQQKPLGVEANLIIKKPRFHRRLKRAPKNVPIVTQGSGVARESEASTEMAQQAEKDRQRKMKNIAIANKQADCERAKTNLAKYTSRGRIRLRSEDGEYRILPDDEKQERISTFKNEIEISC